MRLVLTLEQESLNLRILQIWICINGGLTDLLEYLKANKIQLAFTEPAQTLKKKLFLSMALRRNTWVLTLQTGKASVAEPAEDWRLIPAQSWGDSVSRAGSETGVCSPGSSQRSEAWSPQEWPRLWRSGRRSHPPSPRALEPRGPRHSHTAGTRTGTPAPPSSAPAPLAEERAGRRRPPRTAGSIPAQQTQGG